MCNAEEFLVAQTGYWHAAATAGTPMFVTMADVETKPIYEIHKETKVQCQCTALIGFLLHILRTVK